MAWGASAISLDGGPWIGGAVFDVDIPRDGDTGSLACEKRDDLGEN